MTRIVVFDCGQKRQSLAHFVDDQEKHHGAAVPLRTGNELPDALISGQAKAISIDPNAIYYRRMRG
jgi:hypothetical protein